MGVVPSQVTATAYLAAACRAAETARPAGRIRDPFAHHFQPPTEQTERAHRKILAAGADEVIARTAHLDAMLLDVAEKRPSCRIINLGAGFCTRPYRLDLPTCALFVEYDDGDLLAYKNTVLAAYQPGVTVRRVALDIRDHKALRADLATHAAPDRATIVVSEGLLPYLPTTEVASLAATLADALPDAVWLTDLISTSSAEAMAAIAVRGGTNLDVYGLSSLDPFERNRWRCTDYRILDVRPRYAGPATTSSSRDLVDGVVALTRML